MINEYFLGFMNCIVFILSYILFQNREIHPNTKTLLYVVFGLSLLVFLNDAFFNAIGYVSIAICMTMTIYLFKTEQTIL